jgi:hypothetical protein
VLDNLQLKGEAKALQVSGSRTSAKPHHLNSNKQPIPLDPSAASEYVRAVERQRADYRQLLLYGPVCFKRPLLLMSSRVSNQQFHSFSSHKLWLCLINHCVTGARCLPRTTLRIARNGSGWAARVVLTL